MNILQILPRLNTGGVERGAIEVAAFLRSHGHNAWIVSEGGLREPELQALGISHIRLSVAKKNPLTMISAAHRLAKIIQDLDIDIVHARSRVPAWIAWRAVRKVNQKRFRGSGFPKIVNFVTTCHGKYSPGYFSRIMGRGKKVIVPSAFIGEHMSSVFGVERDKIVVVPRGVDFFRFRYNQVLTDRLIFVVIGRITRNKGQHIAIEAFARATQGIEDAELWIVGDDRDKASYIDSLRSLINRFSISHRVKFLGHINDVERLFPKVYAVLAPSLYPESFGRVVVEAQAAGCPVIASDIPAFNELIRNEKNGLLARVGDVEDWAGKIARLIKDRPLCERIRLQARRDVERFSVEAMCESVLSVYEEVANNYSIGLIKGSALGDLVLAGYAFVSLRASFPSARLFWAGTDLTRELWGDRYKVLSSGKRLSARELGKRMKEYGVDMVFDLQNSRASHIAAFLSGAYRRVGFNRKGGFLWLTDPIPYNKSFPLEEQAAMLKAVGLSPVSVPRRFLDIDLQIRQEVALKLEANLSSGRIEDYRLVGIIISANWPSKRLSPSQVAKVVNCLMERDNVAVVLLGTEGDREAVEELISLLQDRDRLIDLVGKTSMKEFIAAIDALALLITPDSAGMHIAFALGRPQIVYFGPTHPNNHLPIAPGSGNGIDYVFADRCYPCYRHRCDSMLCMEGLEELICDALRHKLEMP